MSNVTQLELKDSNISSANSNTTDYLSKIKVDGSFPDIDYADTSQTNWKPLDHLNRLKPMVLSYIHPQSSYFENEELYNTIVEMLKYWHQSDPTSTNWFNWEIGWPQRMGVILILMRSGKEKIPADVENNILNRMKSISKGPNQAGSQGTGANKMDIAMQWIYRTCLQADKTNLDFAVNQLYLPLTFNLGEGLQHDYSYLQHGMQLYIGGYGNSVLTVMTKAAFYFEETEYETTGERLNLISEFVRRAYIPAIRGKYMLYNAVGRGLAVKNGINRSGFPSQLQKMIELDPEHTTEYENSIKRIEGTESVEFAIEDSHRHFWRGDYTLHQRPGYTMDVRMASTRTCRNENGNGENLKGYFLTDGAAQIAVSGDEYVDIFPVWDWARIPGITAPQVKSIPQPSQWEKTGMSRFTGGVSDGLYGVTTYHLQDLPGYASYNYNINTEAKKSWFFFDNEIVCLGSGIQSTNANPINTTINQCLLSGDVNVELADNLSSTLSKGSHSYANNLSWAHHNKIAYYFPEGGNIELRNDSQSGTWNSISSNSNDATRIEKDVFKLWIDHGVKPRNSNYSYVIVPNTTSIEEAKNKLSDVEVLVNNEKIQAVYHKDLNILGVVFYKAGILTVGDITIRSREACSILFKNPDSENIDVYIADPSCNLNQVTLLMQHPTLGDKELICVLDNSKAYAGSTHKFVINSETPDYEYIPVTSVSLDKEELSLSIDNLFSKLTATVIPSNATEPEIIWTSSNEKVAKVNQEGNIIAYGSGEAIISVTTEDGNFTAECKITVEDNFKSYISEADSYIYDNEKASNFGTATVITIRKDGSNYERRGFFRFPIGELDNIDFNTQTAKIKIALYVESGADNVTEVNWQLYPVDNITWDEYTINWNNRPANGTTLLAQKRCIKPSGTTFSASNIVEFDLTEYALAQYAKGVKSISLFFDQDKRASAGKGTSNFASKEHADIARHPRIIFEPENKPVGLEKPNTNSIKLHPTITSDYVYINTDKTSNVYLFNTLGTLLQSFQIEPAMDHKMDLRYYNSGVYFIKINELSYKIIKD
ncbi:MAG: DNRLRE domain-containing protein [Bacteroidales bacterium]|nr:DNRLRE domain-containing protein [Bacteroidales bacterium]